MTRRLGKNVMDTDLDEGTDDAKGGKAEILKGTCLRCGVKEWV